MIAFSTASMLLGASVAAISALCATAPRSAGNIMKAFPRSAGVGIALAILDLLWSAWLLLHTPLGGFEYLKPAVYFVTPLSIVAIAVFLRELIAPRALGGLLLLLGSPLLDLARWNESQMRLVLVVFVYALVLAGMALILNPSIFRKATAQLVADERKCRIAGIAGTLLGFTMFALGLFIY